MSVKEKMFRWVISHDKLMIVIFFCGLVVSFLCQPYVSVNYDMNDYLPKDSPSTVALDVMNSEFSQGASNARVMISNVDVVTAIQYKKDLLEIPGVTEVLWLDDVMDTNIPLEMEDKDTIESYYKDETALYQVTIEDERLLEAVSDIRELIGEENAMAGTAVNTAVATESTEDEIRNIIMIAVPFCFLVLILTTTSWFEHVLLLSSIGIAILLNAGSNLIFGEISFVTNAAGSILQLAVSLDYSVFLLHRFHECRAEGVEPKEAMVQALCKSTGSVLSSGLTTVIGFLALVLMRFRLGPDMGLALAKGITFSLLVVFFLTPILTLYCYKLIDKTKHRSFMPSFHGFGIFAVKIMKPLVIVFAIIMIPSYLGSLNNEYYYGSSHIFGEGTKIYEDTEKIEGIFGKANQFVLMVPKGDFTTERELSDALYEIPEVTDIISYVDMAGAEIPVEYVDSETISMLISNYYSRMILTVKSDYEGEEAFRLVEDIRKTAHEYYGDEYYLAGEAVSTYDLMNTVTGDMVKVNLVAIGAVFVVLLLSMKSLSLPFILVLAIETAIWINLSIPYYQGMPLFYIGYLIISSIQLGATVDYAILFTDRYMENRAKYHKKEAVIQTISAVSVSILTSGIILTVMGFLLGVLTTHGMISQLGYLLGKGTLCSLVIVFFVLPGLLYVFDRVIQKTTKGTNFINEEKERSRKMKKRNTKIAAWLLIGTVTMTSLSQGITYAASDAGKEEVVYVNLKEDGTVLKAYVVNSFTNNKITDYGEYNHVKNLNTKDEINYSGNRISIQNSAEKLYYEGELKEIELPWDIKITYRFNGKPCTAAEIAGNSGALSMKISIKENKNAKEGFFENYALQAALTFDTSLSKNIVSEGATIANAGKNKLLTYTILPGQEKDISVTADVENFKMDSISINAVKLDLGIDKETLETDLIYEKTDEIKTAASDLDHGTKEVKNGIGQVKGGSYDLLQGADTLRNGIYSYMNGVNSLSAGTNQLQSGISDAVDGTSALSEGANALKEGAESLESNTKELSNGASKLNQQVQNIKINQISLTEKQIAQIQEAARGSDEIKSAAAALTSEVSDGAASGVSEAIVSAQTINSVSIILQSAGIETSLSDQLATAICGGIAGNITADTIKTETLQQTFSSVLGEAAAAGAVSGAQGVVSQVNTELLAYDQTVTELKTAVKSLAEGSGSLAEGTTALSGAASEVSGGISGLSSGMQEMESGVKSLAEGTSALQNNSGSVEGGANELKEGVSTLYDGTKAVYDGISELKDGTGEFRKQTKDIDEKIETEIDSAIENMTGADFDVISFVSEKNEDVKSVQFVLKTPAIEKEESETLEDISTEEEPGFLQKFLNLFQ